MMFPTRFPHETQPMRTLFAVTLLAGFALVGRAQEAKQDPPKKERPKPAEPTLKVGDAAPELKATKWLQGTEVKEFAKDHVYVVEFWATWCGPCIVMMPHMGELQAQYKGKVTFVGYSAKDPNNSAEKVAAMVEKRGPKLGYTFAYAEDRDSYDNWMKAAGRNGIPCCFVVGKDTKIAYIGHPMYLDVVLPKVVAGTWTADDVEGIKKVEADVSNVFKALGGDAEEGLKTVTEFETKYPQLAHIPYFTGPKINLLLKGKKYDEAKKMGEEVIARAVKQEDPTALRTVSSVMRSPLAKEQKELVALSVKAGEAGVKVAGDKDAVALYFLAEAHFAAGDKSKAQEFGKKAVAAAENESAGIKRQIEAGVKKFED
jgi:thiol-disulfide isomerase/thioredoxin